METEYLMYENSVQIGFVGSEIQDPNKKTKTQSHKNHVELNLEKIKLNDQEREQLR